MICLERVETYPSVLINQLILFSSVQLSQTDIRIARQTNFRHLSGIIQSLFEILNYTIYSLHGSLQQGRWKGVEGSRSGAGAGVEEVNLKEVMLT